MRLLTVGLPKESVVHLQSRYVVDEAADREDAISLIKYGDYDACVAQMGFTSKMFPYHIRSRGLQIPLIMLTGKSHEVRAGLVNNGADLCLQSPGWSDELIAGINACIRRRGGFTSKLLDFSGLIVNIDDKSVSVNGNPLNLTQKEYAIVEAIAVRHPMVASTEYIYSSVYIDNDTGIKVIHVFMCKIRNKIKEHSNYMFIKNVRARGFVMRKNHAN